MGIGDNIIFVEPVRVHCPAKGCGKFLMNIRTVYAEVDLTCDKCHNAILIEVSSGKVRCDIINEDQ